MKIIERFCFCLLLLLFAGTVYSQTSDDERMTTFLKVKSGMKTNAAHEYLQMLFPEWELKKMKNICLMVGARTLPEDEKSPYKYMYQERFYGAAKVDITKDGLETAAPKIAAMWKVYQQTGYTGCNASTFDVREGSLLKYAVAEKFDDFLLDVIKWKLDLNKVDFYDQMTLLDYIKLHIQKNTGTALEPVYQRYYNMFRKAGAKHKTEL